MVVLSISSNSLSKAVYGRIWDEAILLLTKRNKMMSKEKTIIWNGTLAPQAMVFLAVHSFGYSCQARLDYSVWLGNQRGHYEK